MDDLRRNLPSVDRVLAREDMRGTVAEVGLAAATAAVREELAERRAVLPGASTADIDVIAAAAKHRALTAIAPSLRPIINASGVILHTNLGRAPLSDASLAAMEAAARGYTNLEFDLDSGERGSRHDHVEGLLRRVTGAPAAMAVNNNAAALLLVLSALARDREIVISRGQLVEIGGGFRIPDVMTQSGARLVEVGTTNRTYIGDYEDAIGASTAGLMRVHGSNFRVVGFVESVEPSALARLAHEHGRIMLDDLGSGCLLDTAAYGLEHEPTPQESIEAGADLVMFSGDKLLGGPQAGIIAGRADLIATVRRHPLARAVRMDKASIAALCATLLHYVKGEAEREVPVWRMIAADMASVRSRAEAWAAKLGDGTTVINGRTMVGGGSLPEESLPTHLLAIRPPAAGPGEFARQLRTGEPAVVARIEHEQVLFDPRTVDPRDDDILLKAVSAALGPGSPDR